MTRFTITLQQGVDFVIDKITKMWGGEIFVPKISSYRIKDVAKAFAPKAKIINIGMRAGEKMHEEMITSSDSYNTLEFKDYYVILPATQDFIKKSDSSPGKFCKENFSYNSYDNPDYVTISELKKMR